MKRWWIAQLAALTLLFPIWSSPPVLAQGPWLPLPGGLVGHNIWALEVSPSGWILAGTALQDPKTMFRSVDFGVTWVRVIGLPDDVEIWDIEIDPTDDSIVYAGLNGAGVWKSTDGGVNWSWSNLYGQIWEIAISPSNPQSLWVASESGGVYKSSDAGGSWTWLSSSGIDNATAVAVHPGDHNIALVGTPFDGIFKTVDGGVSWSQVNTGFGFTPDIRSLLIDFLDPSIVYAGEMWQGVYKSTDGGDSWFKPDPSLFAAVGEIKALDADLFVTNVFDDDGIPVYRSSDGGLTWVPLPRLPGIAGNLWPRSLEPVPGAVLIGTDISPNPGGIYLWKLPVTAEVILTQIEDAVALGDLEGTGGGSSGDGRLGAFINMIQLTAELIDAGSIDEACDQLLDALLKTDGEAPPPDFLEGPAAEDLELNILELRENMGCN